MRFIGDVHGKFAEYEKIIADVPESIQVGDFGIGFGEPPTAAMAAGYHCFIRGNHDNPAECKKHPYWLPDDSTHYMPRERNNIDAEFTSVFCAGGALSIDKQWRTSGFDYWPDEELSDAAWRRALDYYEASKPDVVVTHDCPESLARAIFPGMVPMWSITRRALDVMWSIHQPKLWIFGHWHVHREANASGTHFICLPELTYVDIDLNAL